MPHERDSSSEERGKVGRSRLAQNFQNGFDGARLTEISSLLLFNHTNRIDKGCRENGGCRRSDKARILTFTEKERKAKSIVDVKKKNKLDWMAAKSMRQKEQVSCETNTHLNRLKHCKYKDYMERLWGQAPWLQ